MGPRHGLKLAIVAALFAAFGGPAATAVTHSLDITVAGQNGATSAAGDGCPTGPLTTGLSWAAGAELAPGVWTPQTTDLVIDLSLLIGGGDGALSGDDSEIRLADDVGWIVLRLRSGDCDDPTLDHDGTALSGSGTWTVASAAAPGNAYRDATGSGTFSFSANVSPGGTGQAFVFQLAGVIDGIDCDVDGRGATGAVTLTGTEDADVICGSPFEDVIEARSGDDRVYGGSGDDRIRGNGGDDELFGGADDDVIHGVPGVDLADGQAGTDRCVARTTLSCERGNSG